ncbi:ABC-F family ATP-binding cassette domain-containing protein [Entomospira culicis]|uniref:Probable ATP-binding protein YbiT n=1 Tax=Entomospira culicis TaxID=2719989 RepID=A0A968KX29_9SPIO|nr:ATP-binding cassette domain-containing protein [Entomospira culicis]NIZ19693.1 ATP-binding cassette domain-containing protein [Entomospira culicis]NIZ69907.1 ATP-binding cassette domain-containing protein [Entomospira culicis]WDI37012.1 ATP-binding cassette domain-containing protein [Entomospira culicis]WDI38641.1 ATP-binding cassette domain-containing protein [Entomospira culicis]
MITIENLVFTFGQRVLFKDVNLKFLPGGCYGVIGANGSGKSTFLKVLAGDLDHDKGSINFAKDQRISVLKQDHFAFDAYTALETVIMGNQALYAIMKERDAIYAKEEMSDEDGIRAGELEDTFAQMGGWEAESDAHTLLNGLGLAEQDHEKMMGDLDDSRKVRALLAQALFGDPDILILDEPTNGLDLESISWLEEFLIKFENIVIVVSHDRHFLNKVCTHIVDIDFGEMKLFTGNYDFWYQTNQMLQKQRKDQAKKTEEKAKELKDFIARFSSNASKSKQATSRKKVLEKLDLSSLTPSSRRFPYVSFRPERPCGDLVLRIENMQLNQDEITINNLNLIVENTDKIAFIGSMHTTKTAFFEAIMQERPIDGGSIEWGQTIKASHFPKDNTRFFEDSLSMTDWLRQYSPENKDETFIRSFLGRMLFSGEESLKDVRVLSGGEKVRCMLSRMMLDAGNVLILDEPTSHLDLESITALQQGLEEFTGVILFNSHDHEFVQAIANRIIEFTPNGIIDRRMSFDDYLADANIKQLRKELWHDQQNHDLL